MQSTKNKCFDFVVLRTYNLIPGGFSEEEPPVSIPNTEVKLLSADDTKGGTPWENMSLPGVREL